MSDRVDDLATDLKKVEHGLGKVEHRLEKVEHRLERVEQGMATLSQSVDERFTQVGARFDGVDAAFVEQRQYTESAYERLDRKMDAGFARVERKLDQFIDVQMTTNDLVDRRLRGLESGQQRPKRR